MWLKGCALLITVLLAAVLLVGCTASNGVTDSALQSQLQPASNNGLTPSFDSTERQASNRISPSQQPGAVSPQPGAVYDPSVVRTADALTSVATPGTKAYRIGPLDVLDISVFQAPELSKTVEVADNGTIDLPLIGETPAAGKTTQELQRELNSRFGAKYLQNPQCTVMVKEFNSSRVTVSGAVKSPGVFPVQGRDALSVRDHGWGIVGHVEFDGACLETNERPTLGREVQRR